MLSSIFQEKENHLLGQVEQVTGSVIVSFIKGANHGDAEDEAASTAYAAIFVINRGSGHVKVQGGDMQEREVRMEKVQVGGDVSLQGRDRGKLELIGLAILGVRRGPQGLFTAKRLGLGEGVHNGSPGIF